MAELGLPGIPGRRALVTGGSRGVGAETARMLARCGASVGISYRARREEAEAVVAQCRAEGVEAGAWACDLADPAAAGGLVGRCVDALGGLELLVANAGIWIPDGVPVDRMGPGQWERTLAINLSSVFHLVRAAIPHLGDGGRIVLVSSTAAQRGEAGHADYAASKGGMISFCKSVAVELAPRGITVNCVAPGWIDTGMVEPALAGEGRERAVREIPLGRIASAADVAGPIAFLCSDLGRHVTAEVLNVNGGSVRVG